MTQQFSDKKASFIRAYENMLQALSGEEVGKKRDGLVVAAELHSYEDHTFSLLFYLFYLLISSLKESDLPLIPGSARILYEDPGILLTLEHLATFL